MLMLAIVIGLLFVLWIGVEARLNETSQLTSDQMLALMTPREREIAANIMEMYYHDEAERIRNEMKEI